MESEEREQGEVAWGVYGGYIKMARAQWWFLFTVMFTVVGNLTQVLNLYSLVLWMIWCRISHVPTE